VVLPASLHRLASNNPQRLSLEKAVTLSSQSTLQRKDNTTAQEHVEVHGGEVYELDGDVKWVNLRDSYAYRIKHVTQGLGLVRAVLKDGLTRHIARSDEKQAYNTSSPSSSSYCLHDLHPVTCSEAYNTLL